MTSIMGMNKIGWCGYETDWGEYNMWDWGQSKSQTPDRVSSL